SLGLAANPGHRQHASSTERPDQPPMQLLKQFLVELLWRVWSGKQPNRRPSEKQQRHNGGNNATQFQSQLPSLFWCFERASSISHRRKNKTTTPVRPVRNDPKTDRLIPDNSQKIQEILPRGLGLGEFPFLGPSGCDWLGLQNVQLAAHEIDRKAGEQNQSDAEKTGHS